MLVFAAFTALQSRYMQKPKLKPAVETTGPAPGASSAAPGAPASMAAAPTAPAAAGALPITPIVPARTVVLETPLYRATFSNLGARLQSFELKRYAAAWGHSRIGDHPRAGRKPGGEVEEGDRVELRGDPAFAFDLGSGAALQSLAATPFAVEESTAASGGTAALTFVARDSAGFEVRQTWRPLPDSYLMNVDVSVAGAPANARDWSLTTRSWPLTSEANPDLEMRVVRSIGLVGKNLHRDAAQGLINKPEKAREGAAHWAGVQSHYFLGVVAPVGAEGRDRAQLGGLVPHEFAGTRGRS